MMNMRMKFWRLSVKLNWVFLASWPAMIRILRYRSHHHGGREGAQLAFGSVY
jgi:hypothetical protein